MIASRACIGFCVFGVVLGRWSCVSWVCLVGLLGGFAVVSTSCEMPDFPGNVLPFQEGGVGQKVRKCYIFQENARFRQGSHASKRPKSVEPNVLFWSVFFFWNVRFSREFSAFHKRWCCSKSLKMLYFSGNRAFQTKIACFETSCEMPDFPGNVLPFQEGGVGQKVRKCYIFQENARFRQGSHASKRPKSVEPNVLFWSVFFFGMSDFPGNSLPFTKGGVARKFENALFFRKSCFSDKDRVL